jgi:hypothetical protein
MLVILNWAWLLHCESQSALSLLRRLNGQTCPFPLQRMGFGHDLLSDLEFCQLCLSGDECQLLGLESQITGFTTFGGS